MLTVQIKNGDEITRALASFPRTISVRVVRVATRKGAMRLVEAFKRKAPVWTGTMRDTAKAVLNDDTASGGRTVSYYIGTAAFYIHMLEFGTVHIRPREDLKEAFEESAQRAVEITLHELGVAINKALAGGFGKIGRGGR